MRIFNADSLTEGDFEEILSFLRAGGVIGFPTDTAYGLGADPFNEQAVQNIFTIKGRPEAKPILLLVNSMAMVENVAVLPAKARAICSRFWPGPLTVIVPARGSLPASVTAGTSTVGLRWSGAVFAERIIGAMHCPLTATSANLSGQNSAVTAEEVRSQLEGRLEVLVDGGVLPSRSGSTLLDLTSDPPRVLREGPIPESALMDVLGALP